MGLESFDNDPRIPSMAVWTLRLFWTLLTVCGRGILACVINPMKWLYWLISIMPTIDPTTTTLHSPSLAATKLAIALHKSLGFTTFLLNYPANFLYDFLLAFIELIGIHTLFIRVPLILFSAFVLTANSLTNMRRIRSEGRCLESRALAVELIVQLFLTLNWVITRRILMAFG